MSYPIETNAVHMPKPPRAQTFDGFLTKQRKQWYDRLFNKRRRQQIPVKDLSPHPKPLTTLSSYMIDPRYLNSDTQAALAAGAARNDTKADEGTSNNSSKWLSNFNAVLVAAAASSAMFFKNGWRKAHYLIPQKYHKTFYSLNGGAKTYVLTGTQKLGAVAAMGTITLSAVLTLSALNASINLPASSAPVSVNKSNTAAPLTTNSADSSVSSIGPDAPTYSTDTPQPAGTASRLSASKPAPCNCMPTTTTTPAASQTPDVTSTQTAPALSGVTNPVTQPLTSTPSSTATPAASSPIEQVQSALEPITTPVTNTVQGVLGGL